MEERGKRRQEEGKQKSPRRRARTREGGGGWGRGVGALRGPWKTAGSTPETVGGGPAVFHGPRARRKAGILEQGPRGHRT